MARMRRIEGDPFTIRLTERQEALLSEVQVHLGIDGRAEGLRAILDAVTDSLAHATPLELALPVEIARVVAIPPPPPPVASTRLRKKRSTDEHLPA